MAKAPKVAPAAAPEPAASTVKSIVDPKYKNKYKDPANRDWLSTFLDENAMATKDKQVQETVGDEKVTKTIRVPDGVDTGKLFAIAKANGIDTAKYEAQSGSHGFGGRMRMTIANMLRRVIKERHGMFNAGGTFTTAPAEMLAKVGAVEKPTHNRDGSKIAKPKAEAPAAETPKEPLADAPKANGKKKAA